MNTNPIHVMSEEDFCELADLLAALADELASVPLATLPTVPRGIYGDVDCCGMRRCADGTYQGDPVMN